jgi:Tol biopolymer transport system component
VDIWVVSAAGGAETRMTSDPAIDNHPAWSPLGDRIAFHSRRSGTYDIWVIAVVDSPVALEHTSWGRTKARYRE